MLGIGGDLGTAFCLDLALSYFRWLDTFCTLAGVSDFKQRAFEDSKMMRFAAMAYTLITVTYGGDVGHSRGYETFEMCEQAKSLALTGMTIEQNKAADDAYAASEKAWDDAHPWREPKEDWERKAVESGMNGSTSNGGPISWGFNGKGQIKEMLSAGMSPSYNSNNGEAVDYVRGRWVMKNKTSIKQAECVLEPPPRS